MIDGPYWFKKTLGGKNPYRYKHIIFLSMDSSALSFSSECSKDGGRINRFSNSFCMFLVFNFLVLSYISIEILVYH